MLKNKYEKNFIKFFIGSPIVSLKLVALNFFFVSTTLPFLSFISSSITNFLRSLVYKSV